MISRYENPRIRDIWSPGEVYERWFQVELEHVRTLAGQSAFEALDEIGPPDPVSVYVHERVTGHDVAAFLRALDDRIQRFPWKDVQDVRLEISKIRSILHLGLTSSDVVDTALAMGLHDSAEVVRDCQQRLAKELERLANRTAGQYTIGRTHGQFAVPMPAYHRWSVLLDTLERVWRRCRGAFEDVAVGKLSGPVGLSEGSLTRTALARLNLREARATQIVPRDRLAHLAYCLGALATTAEAIATQVWLLAQENIGELRVAPVGRVGSSAMPHKANPILAENVRGLVRMARSAAELLQIGMVQWGEHDLAHSSVERVAVPDLLHLVCTALERTATLVSGVVWEEPTIPEGYVDTSVELRRLQVQGVPYVDAHDQLTASYRDGKIPHTTTEEGQ